MGDKEVEALLSATLQLQVHPVSCVVVPMLHRALSLTGSLQQKSQIHM